MTTMNGDDGADVDAIDGAQHYEADDVADAVGWR